MRLRGGWVHPDFNLPVATGATCFAPISAALVLNPVVIQCLASVCCANKGLCSKRGGAGRALFDGVGGQKSAAPLGPHLKVSFLLLEQWELLPLGHWKSLEGDLCEVEVAPAVFVQWPWCCSVLRALLTALAV